MIDSGVNMKPIVSVGLLILLYSVSFGQNKVTKLADLNGMAGCWEHRDAKRGLFTTEIWMKPAGTSILGIGRTVKGGKTVDHEYMRIEQREDGLFFIARPKENAEETAFKLVRSTVNEVVFENKEHDFPQRVIYRLNGTAMTGRIEGLDRGRPKGIDFPMERAKCS